MADGVKAVVLLDSYRWLEDPKNPDTSAVNEAAKGEEISVSADEYKRGESMVPQALAKPGSDEAKAAADGASPNPDEPPITTPAGDVVEDYDPPPKSDKG